MNQRVEDSRTPIGMNVAVERPTDRPAPGGHSKVIEQEEVVLEDTVEEAQPSTFAPASETVSTATLQQLRERLARITGSTSAQ
jgi:hypothetical protein